MEIKRILKINNSWLELFNFQNSFNAGKTIHAVAMNIGCSTCAFRHPRQRFQATGRTEDQPCNGRLHVTTHGQRYLFKRL